MGGGVHQVAVIAQSDTLRWNRFFIGSLARWPPLDELTLERTKKILDAAPQILLLLKGTPTPLPDQHFCRLEISNGGPERHLKLLFFKKKKKKSFLSVGDLFSAEQFQLWLWERIGEDMCNVCERMSC